MIKKQNKYEPKMNINIVTEHKDALISILCIIIAGRINIKHNAAAGFSA